jgi:hypothetical protein
MGVAFAPRKNLKFLISIPHSTLKMWKRRRKLRSKLLRRRLRRRRKIMMMRRKMRRRTEKRKEIELKGGKHNRTAL